MADQLLRAQVTIELDGAVPEDYIVNTWHFDGDDAVGIQDVNDYYQAVFSLLDGFYASIDEDLFANSISGPAQIKLYDMRDPVERQPVATETLNLTSSASPPLPAEVALCLSFRAAYESGVNPQRRRGRIFLGPIAQSAMEVVAGQARPTAAVRNLLAAAAGTMQEGVLLNVGDPERMRWSIYSPTTDATQDIGLAFNDVLDGWIDNAFDTQRRRGPVATARTTF
jgi:hypothetical protein